METADFSVALFPFLKTSAPVQIGPYLFRSTSDVEGLPDAQAGAVSELAAMLYLRDDVRIATAAYAIVPALGSLRPGPVLEGLDRVRAIVGYVYSAPHPTSGDIFLPFDMASLAVVAPAPVFAVLMRPHHGVLASADASEPEPDRRGYMPGYEGAFNLREPLWLTARSRLYGPRRQMSLNISQDLTAQFQALEHYPESATAMLVDLMDAPPGRFQDRVFSALGWYNNASEEYGDTSRSLLDLAIAFETLLQLPAGEKTERLTDAISLLLGRTERLSDWAAQFYKARSSVAHEGRVQDWRFYAPVLPKKGDPQHSVGSVMTFGRHVFQLCLTTLLTGARLARDIGLKDRFVSNSERYAEINEALGQISPAPRERLLGVSRAVFGLSTYRFVGGGGPTIPGMVAPVRLASQALLACDIALDDALRAALNGMATAPKKDDFAGLQAMSELAQAFEALEVKMLDPVARVVCDLVKLAWESLFMTYFAWKEAKDREAAGRS